jgi:DNA repair protein RAD57
VAHIDLVEYLHPNSASGKTQLALQLSLLVQLPRTLGGISGSACYLTVQGVLETRRIVAICDAHPLLSPSVCTLDDIHTVKAPTIPLLQKVLDDQLPLLITSRAKDPSKRPVKLIVIDSIADLFPSLEKNTASTLAERSKSLAEISMVLHRIAKQHQIAVIVLNRVGDVFANDWGSDDSNTGAPGDLVYRDQTQWYSRADTIHEERNKEAALGLVWANQVNVRIMFTRTTRRRYLEEVGGPAAKRRRGENTIIQAIGAHSLEQDTTLLRRLTVIFSSVSTPGSIDFILTEAGLSAPLEIQTNVPLPSVAPRPPNTLRKADSLAEVSPLDVGSAEAAIEPSTDKDVDDDDSLWDTLTQEDEEFYQNLDLGAQ